jgi:hypothetical protein
MIIGQISGRPFSVPQRVQHEIIVARSHGLFFMPWARSGHLETHGTRPLRTDQPKNLPRKIGGDRSDSTL